MQKKSSLLKEITSYPLVSIAMCTYNGADYLYEQLVSIVDQTYQNLEIIIVDDASIDDTVLIISQMQKKDHRIKLFQNDVNLGYNKNFQRAFSLCSGDCIAVSDQDDIWETSKIEVMMRDWPDDCNFIYSLSGVFIGNHFEQRMPPPPVTFKDIDNVFPLVFNSPIQGHGCMFKKELLPACVPFPENIFYDWWMSMHAAATGKIACIPQTLTWHRMHDNNYSRDIMSIPETKQRNQRLRQQCAFFIETFCKRDLLHPSQKNNLLEYASLLKELNGNNFSWSMFKYVIKHRKLIFHYKKQHPLILFSYLKHAYRMGYKGLL